MNGYCDSRTDFRRGNSSPTNKMALVCNGSEITY